MFQIDERIDIARRRQFAGEFRKLPLGNVEQIRECVKGEESEEFYAGMLAGLASATVMIQQGHANAVQEVTAGIADFCESKEYSS